jgi:hypothetical protein
MKRWLVIWMITSAAYQAHAEDGLRGRPADLLCATNAAGERHADASRVPGCTGACAEAAETACRRTIAGGAAPSATTPVASTSWQGAVVTGLGELIADRAKQELEAWFEQLLRSKLCDLHSDAAGQRQDWFPATCRLIKDGTGAGQQLASPLVVRTIQEDMPDLLGRILAYLAPRVAGRRPWEDLVAIAPTAMAASYELATGRSPFIVLRDRARDPALRTQCQARTDKTALTAPCAIAFAGITLDYFGPVIKTLNSIDDLKHLALTLLAEGKYRCEVSKAMSGSATCTAADDASVPRLLLPLLDATVVTTPGRIEQLFKVIADANALNAYLVSLDTGHPPSPDEIREQIATVLDKLDALWTDLAVLVWGAAPPRTVAMVHALLAAGIAAANRDYRMLAVQLVALATSSGVALPAWAARLLPLVVDLAEAKTAGDASAALARAAAPIGSWKLKRQKPLLSFTALVGGAVGYEAPTRDAMGAQSLPGGWAAGAMAPIGLHASIPVGRSSLGLLVSILDVGQITWTRLRNHDPSMTEAGTRAAPEATFSRVFSPGGYLVIGAGHSPITFGLGVSYAPELRTYTYQLSGTLAEQSVSVLRVGAFVAVDVTLFPFPL